MKVEVSATGRIKKFLPEQKNISISENSSIKDIMELLQITNDGVAFVVNGLIGKRTDILKNGDHIKFIMVVGAG
ncbi:MAG: MoaD/ThiS family protein [Spirochaetaceae bacterium]